MEFAQLEALVHIAREHSFSRAAEHLSRTQPAVSISIKKLEEEIGAPLLDRSRKNVVLTDAGLVMVEYAQKMLNMRNEVSNAIDELRQLRQGKVTIGANESTSLYYLPAVIMEFRAQNPGVKVEVHRSLSERLPQEVKERNVDLGVLSFDPSDAELESFPVLQDELVLIVPPSHAMAKLKSVSIRELGSETFVAHNVKSPSRQHVVETFRKHRVPLNITIELATIETIKKFVELHFGIGFVPRMCVDEELARGTLVSVPVKELRYQRTLRVVYLRDRIHSHAGTRFLDLLLAGAAVSKR
ncbi:MAG: LysR family transcriptional regulator [Acidobacteria bacterium]|nr:LysR family transcriptional regulator [Acidobacteriota bacterium]